MQVGVGPVLKSSNSSVSLSVARVCARSRRRKFGSSTTTATAATGSPGEPSVSPPAQSSLLRSVRCTSLKSSPQNGSTSNEASAAGGCEIRLGGRELMLSATTGGSRSASQRPASCHTRTVAAADPPGARATSAIRLCGARAEKPGADGLSGAADCPPDRATPAVSWNVREVRSGIRCRGPSE